MSENANTTTLREADNRVFIEGIISEINLEEKTIEDKVVLSGTINIKTDENSVYTINVYAPKMTKDGKDNPVYKGMLTVMNEYKSIAKHGKENADKVRVSGARLTVNDYYNNAGELRSNVQIQASFVNRLKDGEEFNPRAEFELEAFIYKLYDETDKKSGDLTGRKIISVIVPMYDGKVVPMEIVVADPDYVSAVESLYDAGNTVRIYGDIVSKVITNRREAQVAIGKPKEIVTTTVTRELVFSGGSEPYEEDSANAFSIEAVKKAMQVREEYLEELKNKNSKENSSGGKKVTNPSNKDRKLPF